MSSDLKRAIEVVHGVFGYTHPTEVYLWDNRTFLMIDGDVLRDWERFTEVHTRLLDLNLPNNFHVVLGPVHA